MKNIEAILAELGIELTDDQKTKIVAAVNENYKTINDYEKQKTKIETLENSLAETKEALKKFDGVDAEKLKSEIADLTQKIEDTKNDYESKIAERDFSDKIDKAIAGAKGKNAKAIKALLDIDAIKSSKNQDKDLESALKALADAEDSKMLFGEAEPENKGKADPIGKVTKGGAGGEESLTSALTAYYTK